MEAACEAGPGAGGAPGGTEGGARASAVPHRSMVEEMLACPCVADLRAGPCGQAFEGAFECYLEQTEPAEAQGGEGGGGAEDPEGAGGGGGDIGACAEAFARLQECMVKHPEEFEELAEYTLRKHAEVP